MIIYIVLAVVFAIASGIFRAISNVISFRYADSIFSNNKFYDPTKSWKNKWKLTANGIPLINQERFWGSSRWFVMFTDAWHFNEFMHRIMFASCFFFVGALTYAGKSYWFASGYLIAYIIFAATFHLFFTKIFIRKATQGG